LKVIFTDKCTAQIWKPHGIRLTIIVNICSVRISAIRGMKIFKDRMSETQDQERGKVDSILPVFAIPSGAITAKATST